MRALLLGFLLLAGLSAMKAAWRWPIPKAGLPYAAAFALGEYVFGLPDRLLARVAWQESRFRDDVITGQTPSSAGALGIMQIVPRWHPNADPLDPPAAIHYAAGFLRQLFDQFGTWPLALAAYNWGPGNVADAIGARLPFTRWPQETQRYVREISADLGLGPLPA